MDKHGKRKTKTGWLLFVMLFGLVLLCYIIVLQNRTDTQKISEVCFYNFSSYVDGTNYPKSWIEIEIDERDENQWRNWSLVLRRTEGKKEGRAVRIGVGEYCVMRNEEFLLIADLSEDSEQLNLREWLAGSLELLDENGAIISRFSFLRRDEGYDISYLPSKDGKGYEVRLSTPGEANTNGELIDERILSKPHFSEKDGVKKEPFSLQIEADASLPSDKLKIYYTLDGTEPTENSILYSGPIEVTREMEVKGELSNRHDMSVHDFYIPEEGVDCAVIVRAKAFGVNGVCSPVATATYLLAAKDNDYFEKYGDETIPILSIVTVPENLVSDEKGILITGEKYNEWKLEHPGEKAESDRGAEANFTQKGRAWEREVCATLICEDQIFQQQCGIRRRGGNSSEGANKGFRLYARNAYGEEAFTGFFDDGFAPKRIVLKNARSVLTDMFFSKILSGRALLQKRYRPVYLFLNGEFWGLYVFMDDVDEHFLEDKWGITDGQVSKFETEDEIVKLSQKIAELDMTDEENYRMACNEINMDSLMDYYCMVIYFGNLDVAEDYNVMAWKGEQWNWCLYDNDSTFGNYESNNMTEEFREGWKPYFEHAMLKSLLKNTDFRNKLIIRFSDMMNFNLGAEHTVPVFEKMVSDYEQGLVLHALRFSGEKKEVARKIETQRCFLEKRETYMWKYLKEIFDLGEPVTVHLKTELGKKEVMFNSSAIQVDEQGVDVIYFPEMAISLSPLEGTESGVRGYYVIRGENREDVSGESYWGIPEDGMTVIIK